MRSYTYSIIDINAFRTWKALDSIPSAISLFSGALQDVSACENNSQLHKVLVELLHGVVEGHIIPRQFVFYLRNFKFHVHRNAQQLLADIIWYVEAECSTVKLTNPSLLEKLMDLVKFIASTVDNSIIDSKILLETLDLDFLDYCELCPSEVSLKTRLKKHVTSIHYKQQKFCLLTEESEGYSKLIVMLYEFGTDCQTNSNFNDEYYDSFMDIIISLIGVFDLDANRVVDLLLDCLLVNISLAIKQKQISSDSFCDHWKPFIYVLSRFCSDHIPHVFGIRLSNEVVLTQSLAALSVLLVEAGIVSPSWFFGYIVSPHSMQPSIDAASSTDLLRSAMHEISNTINQQELTTGNSIKSTGMTSLSLEVRNTKSPVISANHSTVDLALVPRNIITFLSEYLKLCGVSSQFMAVVDTLALHASHQNELLSNLFCLKDLSMGLYEHANNYIMIRMRALDPVLSYKPYDEVISDGISCLQYLSLSLSQASWLIGLHGGLFCRLARLVEFYLTIIHNPARYQSEFGNSWSLTQIISDNSVPNYWFGRDNQTKLTGQLGLVGDLCCDMAGKYLLPSLASCGDGNFPCNISLWNVLRHFDFSVRYSWYLKLLQSGMGKTGYAESHESKSNHCKPTQCYLMETEALHTLKSYMKRLSGDNVKLQGRNMAKIACKCPLIVAAYISNQIESYDNLIDIIIEAVQFIPALSRDVLLFWMLNSLRKEEGEVSIGKDRMKKDGMNFAQWIVGVARFIGQVFYRYNDDNADIYAVLRLVMQRLVGATDGFGSECVDLLILRDLIGYAGGGVWSISQVDDEKIPALSGGPLLRQHTIIQKLPWTATCATQSLSAVFVAVEGVLGSSGGKDFAIAKTLESSTISSKSIKSCADKLRNALFDNKIGLQFISVISSLKERAIFDTESTQLKFISSLHDLCQEVILQLVTFMCDNYCHNSSVSIADCMDGNDFQLPRELSQLWDLLVSFSSLIDGLHLPMRTAFIVARPLMRAALVSHYVHHLKIMQSESKSKRGLTASNMKLLDMLKLDLNKMQSNNSMIVDGDSSRALRQLWWNWHPLSPLVVSRVNQWMTETEVCRPVTNLSFDENNLIRNSMIVNIPEFFALSQSLALYDLEFPKSVYEDDISRLIAASEQLDKRRRAMTAQMDDSNVSSELLDVANGILSQAKKEIARLKPASDDLKAEMNFHNSHVSIVQNIVSCLRNDLLPRDCDDKVIVSYNLNHWCWLPRCTHSPEEARMTSLSATLLSSTTEGEARNIGFLIRELLKFGNRWFTSHNIYTREFESKNGAYANKFNDNQKLSFNSFCDGHKGAEANLVRAISLCVQSKEYMNRKSGLSVLRKSMQFFPKYARMCKYMMKFLRNLVDSFTSNSQAGEDEELKGAEDQDDIRLIAEQLLLALEEKLPSLIGDMADGSTKSKPSVPTATVSVSKTSRDGKHKNDDAQTAKEDDTRKRARLQPAEDNTTRPSTTLSSEVQVDPEGKAESDTKKWRKRDNQEDEEVQVDVSVVEVEQAASPASGKSRTVKADSKKTNEVTSTQQPDNSSAAPTRGGGRKMPPTKPSGSTEAVNAKVPPVPPEPQPPVKQNDDRRNRSDWNSTRKYDRSKDQDSDDQDSKHGKSYNRQDSYRRK